MGGEEATELIFKLEKYGSGWGEELLPRLTVEQRPIKKRIRIRNRSSFPDAWQVRTELWYLSSMFRCSSILQQCIHRCMHVFLPMLQFCSSGMFSAT